MCLQNIYTLMYAYIEILTGNCEQINLSGTVFLGFVLENSV